MIRKFFIIAIIASMMVIWYAVNQPAFAGMHQVITKADRCNTLRTWIANSYRTSFDTRYPATTEASATRAAALQEIYFKLNCDVALLADKITREKEK